MSKTYTEVEVIKREREAYRAGVLDMYFDASVPDTNNSANARKRLQEVEIEYRYPLPVQPTVVREPNSSGHYEFRIRNGVSEWRHVSDDSRLDHGTWSPFYLSAAGMATLVNTPTTEVR